MSAQQRIDGNRMSAGFLIRRGRFHHTGDGIVAVKGVHCLRLLLYGCTRGPKQCDLMRCQMTSWNASTSGLQFTVVICVVLIGAVACLAAREVTSATATGCSRHPQEHYGCKCVFFLIGNFLVKFFVCMVRTQDEYIFDKTAPWWNSNLSYSVSWSLLNMNPDITAMPTKRTNKTERCRRERESISMISKVVVVERVNIIVQMHRAR